MTFSRPAAALGAAWLGLGLTGCATMGPKYLAPGFTPPKTVAVLPLANKTQDTNAVEGARYLFHEAIEGRGYTVVPLDKTDQVLHEQFGIDEGGQQLQSVDPRKLGQSLGVDALIYGAVLAYKSLNVGVYQNMEVELSFQLVDAHTGKPLWEQQKKAWDRALRTTLKDAAGAAATGLLDKYFIHAPPGLEVETQKAVKWCALTLPRASGKSDSSTTKSSSYSHSTTTTTEEE